MDHILHSANTPFLSSSFLLPSTNFETMAMASVIDLPQEVGQHETVTENSKFTMTAKANAIVFCKEIKERQDDRLELDVIINQSFFDTE